MQPTQILIVENEIVVAEDLSNRLKNLGYVVLSLAVTGEEAVQKSAQLQPDLILMDIMLDEGMDGIDAAGEIHSQDNTPIIYVTAFADKKTLQRARITEPHGYIIKPFNTKDLQSNIEMTLYKHEMERKLQENQEKLRQMAITDYLTGIFNRRHFFELAETELERARRYQHPFSIILFDIDRFKRVNDTYGHAAGDQVLCTITAQCRENLRENDIFARYGGEEFVILLPETSLERAKKMAERTRENIANFAIEIGDASISITISFGVASLANGTLALDELLARADKALYASKEAGRNCVTAWPSEEDEGFLDATHFSERSSTE